MSGSLKLVDIVKRFKGERDENIDQWFRRYETAVSIVTAPKDLEAEMARMMPLFLDGPAFATWDQLEPTDKNDFKVVMKALKRVYGLNKASAWLKLKSLRLWPGEQIDIIADDAKTLLKVITGKDPDEELVSLAVIDALPADVKEKVYIQDGEDMKLQDVLSTAKALLATRDALPTAVAATMGPQNSQMKVSKQMVRCQGCRRFGHEKASCIITCFFCNEKGHIQRFCPHRQQQASASMAAATEITGAQISRPMNVNGQRMNALIDTGSVTSVIGEHVVGNESRSRSYISLQSFGRHNVCAYTYVVLSSVITDNNEELGPINAYVVLETDLPTGIDIILGSNVFERTGLILHPRVRPGTELKVDFPYSKGPVVSVLHSDDIHDKDFVATFNGSRWCVRWNWRQNLEPGSDCKIPYNIIDEQDKSPCDAEINDWINEGILVRHDVSFHGKIKRYLPIIAVRQQKGDTVKVRPVLDYRSLNESIESHTAEATPTCADTLRQWRQLGPKCSIIDLKRAYLQVEIDPSLWAYQAVRWKGSDFLLTRLGFGLASAPKIMTAIVTRVLQGDQKIKEGTSSYIDDIYVSESVVSCEKVRSHLNNWGLITKESQKVGKGDVRLLGLCVDSGLRWRRDGSLPLIANILTRREAHKYIGECLGHYPVAGWLRVACAFVQRCTAEDHTRWDDPVSEKIMSLIREIDVRLKVSDPVGGMWEVDPKAPITVWTDSSSLAYGVYLEVEGQVVEDAAWLRPKDDATHINRSELDAAIKGLNLALKWGKRDITIKTDSISVYRWLQSVIHKTRNVKTRALAEVLIKRRLNIISDIIREEQLAVQVVWIESSLNKADSLTRVPNSWVREKLDSVDYADIKFVHEINHFGTNRTYELCKERYKNKSVSKSDIKAVIGDCATCTRIDPSNRFSWDKGSISANNVWEVLGTDVTHVDGRPYLSVIDTASRFTIWRSLRNESSTEIAFNIEQIFAEFGPPAYIMSDNGTVFRSREFNELLDKWKVQQVLTSAYRPQGNSVVERVHRTVKRTVKRTGKSLAEAVFWVNNTKGKNDSTPYELVFCAKSRKPDVTADRIEIERPKLNYEVNDNYFDKDRNPFLVGDKVFLKPPSSRCDDVWSGPHVVTKIISSVSVELDDINVSRHVSHLRLVPYCRESTEVDLETKYCSLTNDSDVEIDSEAVPRRSSRVTKRPIFQGDHVVDYR